MPDTNISGSWRQKQMFAEFTRLFLKFFFILTPFFVLSMFLSMTGGWSIEKKVRLSFRVTAAILLCCLFLLLAGPWFFGIFGITVDAFRVGGGALLFLSAIQLVNFTPDDKIQSGEKSDIAVVPLAIPVTVGPATTAVLFVTGADNKNFADWLLTGSSLTTAVLCLGVLLFLASRLEQFMGKRGLSILTKLTGLILSALAAQMILTGIKNFLN